ncbi:MAG: hypothetical protein IPG45_23615 [Deltaproteobacteria bacterium]|nr:hypothetical protein [Deltaproteobacteria bacterium]
MLEPGSTSTGLLAAALGRLFHRAGLRLGAHAKVDVSSGVVGVLTFDQPPAEKPFPYLQVRLHGAGRVEVMEETLTRNGDGPGAVILGEILDDLRRRVDLEKRRFVNYEELLAFVESRFESDRSEADMCFLDGTKDPDDSEDADVPTAVLNRLVIYGEEWIQLTVDVPGTEGMADAQALLENTSTDGCWLARHAAGEMLELRATFPIAALTGARFLELVSDLRYQCAVIAPPGAMDDEEDDEEEDEEEDDDDFEDDEDDEEDDEDEDDEEESDEPEADDRM